VFFLVSAALHSVTDVFGGGLELRPWRGESERAVCDHFRGTWISPRRWVRYDGSPKDLLLAVGPAVPALLVYGEHVRTVIFALLLVSGGYALVRKPLVDVMERLVRRFPESFARRLPERFVKDFR
jgi:hypothetical protein